MSTNVQSTNNADGTPLGIGEQLRSFTLGFDGEGARHVYHRTWDAVVVHQGRDLVRIERLEGRPLTHWLDFVDEERGWQSYGQLASLGIGADARRKGVGR